MVDNCCRSRVDSRALVATYMDVKHEVIAKGYADEIDWQYDVSLDQLTESIFLREAAWVVFSAGFRETVLRQKFQSLSEAFLDWMDAQSIVSRRNSCRKKALHVINHQGKVDAVLEIARTVATEGFNRIVESISQNGIDFLRGFPFIGPVTAFHLAKNIGLPVVKPDRHLVRVAQCLGYTSPLELCLTIANTVGDPLPVVDLVIWRYATLNPDYVSVFSAH